jgi:hypothetical protein
MTKQFANEIYFRTEQHVGVTFLICFSEQGIIDVLLDGELYHILLQQASRKHLKQDGGFIGTTGYLHGVPSAMYSASGRTNTVESEALWDLLDELHHMNASMKIALKINGLLECGVTFHKSDEKQSD